MTLVFVPKETRPGERRVACSADLVRRLVARGLEVAIEAGAGEASGQPDGVFADAGARVARSEVIGDADVVLAVQPPALETAAALKDGATWIGFLAPHAELDLVRLFAERRLTSIAMELVPRTTRAQAMDALSSQATVAGYKAVLLAAGHLTRLCPLLMTAAGTVKPARAVVFGAGVAGLQAIATARRLGCIVEATDVRHAAKEQVMSLGARFIDVEGAADLEGAGGYAKEATEDFLQRQRAEVAKRVAEADIVITTALVQGRRAPLLVTEEMVRSMRPGSVVVDLAVEAGGNCALVEHDRIVERHGVTIVGIANVAATVPFHASELYAKNLSSLLLHAVPKGASAPRFDPADEILGGCLLTLDGAVRHAPTAVALGQSQAPAAPAVEPGPPVP